MSDVAKLNEAAELLAEVESHPPRFVPYARYAASTIPSVPILPTGWRSKPLKFVARLNPEELNDSTDPDYLLKYVDISNVDYLHGIVDSENYRFEDAPSRARRRVRDGDTIISTVRTYLKAVAQIDNPPEDLIVSTGFAVLRPSSEVDARFLYRAVQSEEFVGRVVAHSTGVSYPAIAPSALGKFEIPLPPLDEQQAIAGFLDRETAKIDSLMAKKRRLIELLGEKRTAMISHAVTKGLNPAAPTKPSGIDWLGDVPEHWDVVKTKRVARLKTGHTPSRSTPEYWENCTIPWFGLVDVWQIRDGRREYLGETSEKISELGLANSAAELLPAQTVVVSRTASVGFSGIMPDAMATTQDFVNWICGPRLVPEYLLYVFRGMRQEFDRLTNGSVHKTIYMPDVYQFRTPVPPVDEQQAIVAFIRRERKKLDDLEDRVASVIERLNEYRSALISAAVTGQIDVRAAAGEEAAA